MKKIFLLLIIVLMISGCGKSKFKDNYKKMQIGRDIESYQLDLRIYGEIDEKQVNKMLKISNYKNEQFQVSDFENTYYLYDGKTYKEISIEDEIQYELVEEEVFINTDIILQGLKKIKSNEKISNDIREKKLECYSITLKKKYIENLLSVFGYNKIYKNASGKVYLDGDNVYKIVYNIDDLVINATFFRINKVGEINIDFSTGLNDVE